MVSDLKSDLVLTTSQRRPDVHLMGNPAVCSNNWWLLLNKSGTLLFIHMQVVVLSPVSCYYVCAPNVVTYSHNDFVYHRGLNFQIFEIHPDQRKINKIFTYMLRRLLRRPQCTCGFYFEKTAILGNAKARFLLWHGTTDIMKHLEIAAGQKQNNEVFAGSM